jgi:U4/U6.U5 tri-snRNP-associated protein 2
MKRKHDDVQLNMSENQDVHLSDSTDFENVIINQHNVFEKIKCPYLDTIDRHAIDFDSEKLCSVTLTNMNVYVCLVCGKYFQGKGKFTPAYTHSVQSAHFVFMNLQNNKSFCLPDGYEIVDSSLSDVEKCLSPTFALKDITLLNHNNSLARDINRISYLPGFIGLNNLNATDYLNVVLHAVAHVTPFRDFWLEKANYASSNSSIVHHFGLVHVVLFIFFVIYIWFSGVTEDVVIVQF